MDVRRYLDDAYISLAEIQAQLVSERCKLRIVREHGRSSLHALEKLFEDDASNSSSATTSTEASKAEDTTEIVRDTLRRAKERRQRKTKTATRRSSRRPAASTKETTARGSRKCRRTKIVDDREGKAGAPVVRERNAEKKRPDVASLLKFDAMKQFRALRKSWTRLEKEIIPQSLLTDRKRQLMEQLTTMEEKEMRQPATMCRLLGDGDAKNAWRDNAEAYETALRDACRKERLLDTSPSLPIEKEMKRTPQQQQRKNDVDVSRIFLDDVATSSSPRVISDAHIRQNLIDALRRRRREMLNPRMGRSSSSESFLYDVEKNVLAPTLLAAVRSATTTGSLQTPNDALRVARATHSALACNVDPSGHVVQCTFLPDSEILRRMSDATVRARNGRLSPRNDVRL